MKKKIKKIKKNICMIVYNEYPRDTRVRREAETLVDTNEFNINVLALKKKDHRHTYKLDGVNVIEMNEKKYCGKKKFNYLLSYFKFLLFSFVECSRLFFLKEVDIVHVHNMPNFLILAAIIPRLFGKKLILDMHDSVIETYKVKFNHSSSLLFKLLYFEESLFCAFANKIICVNHVQRDTLVKRGIPASKISISMNVPDDKRFYLKAGDTKIAELNKNSKFRMIYHGTVVHRLGVDLIIRAVKQLIGEIDNLEFHIWTKFGDDLEDFIRLSKELNLQDRVLFNGEVPLEILPLKLKSMDLGVVGNRKNIATDLMLPVKMLEYVAIGLPVVAPRLKCIEYYFSDEMVCFFEPGNINSIVNAILRLYEDESLRKSKVQKAKVFLKRYGWTNHKKDLINLYRTL